eukprot:UN06210
MIHTSEFGKLYYCFDKKNVTGMLWSFAKSGQKTRISLVL